MSANPVLTINQPVMMKFPKGFDHCLLSEIGRHEIILQISTKLFGCQMGRKTTT